MLRWGIHDCLDEAYVPFFGAFGTARDDAIIARWSANPLAMLWPGGAALWLQVAEWEPPAAVQHPVVIIAAAGRGRRRSTVLIAAEGSANGVLQCVMLTSWTEVG